jgi:hypothetical protein
MNLQDLNLLVADGCAIPNCTTHDHKIYFHSKCHTDIPLIDKMDGSNFKLNCIKCGSIIVNLENVFGIKLIGHSCERALWASYKLNSNEVILWCYFCTKEIGKVYMGEPQSNISVH